MKGKLLTLAIVTVLLSGCASSFAPQINPTPYYTYYPASLQVMQVQTEKALRQAGMTYSGTRTVSADTIEIRGYDPNGEAILITLHSMGPEVTRFTARIGLYGHLREVQEIEHWLGKDVGEAISYRQAP